MISITTSINKKTFTITCRDLTPKTRPIWDKAKCRKVSQIQKTVVLGKAITDLHHLTLAKEIKVKRTSSILEAVPRTISSHLFEA